MAGTTINPYRFGGQVGYRRDGTNRNYVHARHLDSQRGRWITRDPIGFAGGDENLYRYVWNEPVQYPDPLGLASDVCRVDNDCPASAKNEIGRLCNLIREPWSARKRNDINQCIQKTAARNGNWCNLLTVNRIQCLRNFCRNGTGAVKCDICTGANADACAYTPGFTDPGSNPTVPPNPVIIFCMNNINSPGCSNFDGSPNLDFNFLHELAHSCGIAHIDNGGDTARQCNDIWACCLYSVLVAKKKGEACWNKVPTGP